MMLRDSMVYGINRDHIQRRLLSEATLCTFDNASPLKVQTRMHRISSHFQVSQRWSISTSHCHLVQVVQISPLALLEEVNMQRQTINLELQSVHIVRRLVTLPECVVPKSRQIDTTIIIFKRKQRVQYSHWSRSWFIICIIHPILSDFSKFNSICV